MKNTVSGIILLFVSICSLTALSSMQFIPLVSAIHEAQLIPSTTVFLTPYRIDGTAGQNVIVYANITNVSGLSGYQIGLIWSNTTSVECTSVTPGSISNSIGSNFLWIPGKINNTLGKITFPYFGVATDNNTMHGNGTLAMFTFHMLQTGYADVHLNGMFMLDVNGDAIPFNTVDYFMAVRGGKQYFVRLEGNPVESSFYGGFGAESVAEFIPPKSINGTGYRGEMTFEVNGTANDVGPFAYFNATIPNSLMNCTSKDNWIVELGGVPQSGVLVSAGTQNTTISLVFSYQSSSNGELTQTIEILSNYIAAGTRALPYIAVVNVVPSKSIIGQGCSFGINATVENRGNEVEGFNVTVYANTTAIGKDAVILTVGNSATITFMWDTADFAYGNYTLWAYASPVPGETNITNNFFTYGIVKVTILGDVNGDFRVNILDVVMITSIYGSKKGDRNFNPNCDLDGDGKITILDVVTCISHYGQKWS
jgi:hypothetical protein